LFGYDLGMNTGVDYFNQKVGVVTDTLATLHIQPLETFLEDDLFTARINIKKLVADAKRDPELLELFEEFLDGCGLEWRVSRSGEKLNLYIEAKRTSKPRVVLN
jgi:hypothetical protein